VPTYRVTVAYDGTEFHGWQAQEPPSGEVVRTVQGVLQETLRHVLREPIIVCGASRTDAGVHAEGQVAVFTTTRELPLDRVARAINSRLPRDVQIRDAAEVLRDFDPIRGAIGKGYRYRIVHGCAFGVARPLFDRNVLLALPHRLDVPSLIAAAPHFVGEHDFVSFTRVHHDRETTIRRVFACEVTEPERDHIHVDIAGNGFLYNMVRIIVGTLTSIGRGQLTPEDVPAILQARDRTAAGPTAPPEGLCLRWVAYTPEECDAQLARLTDPGQVPAR